MDTEALVRPVVESAGLELVEVSFEREGGRRVLRVTVDREGGVDLETISRTSEAISRRLDLEEDRISGSYALEVSSPGVERSLRHAEDFAARIGETVRVKTAEPVDGSRTHQGVLASAGGESVVVTTEAGPRRLSLAGITSARTVFDWDAELRSRR